MPREGRSGLGHVPLGAGAMMALLVLVAGIGFFGPDRVEEDAPTSPEVATASAAPTPVTRSPRPLRSPTPVPTLPPGAIFVGNPQWTDWSPSGAEIAVGCLEAVGTSGIEGFVHVLDRTGRLIDRIRADDFRWLTASSYVASAYEVDDEGAIERTTFVGWVGSERRETMPHDVAIYGTAGSRVALASALPSTAGDTFYVWSPDGLVGPRPGMPEVFSPNGSLLAVALLPVGWSSQAETRFDTTTATLEIVDAASGGPVAKASSVIMAANVLPQFSPDSRYLAFAESRDSASPPGEIGLLDVTTNRFWTVPAPSIAMVQWVDDTHLRAWTSGRGSVNARDTPVTVEYVTDQSGAVPMLLPSTAVSSRGWTATWDDRASVVNVDKNGSTSKLSFGGVVQMALWSPEGSDLLVVWGSSQLVPNDGGGYRPSAQFVSIVRP